MWWNDYFEYQWANFLRLSVNIAPATVCSTNCECMFVFLEHFFLLTEVKNYIRNSLAENSQSEYLNLNICYFVANQRFANHCQTLKPSKCKSAAIMKSTHREWGRRLLQNGWLLAIVVFPVMIWNRDVGQIWRQETGRGDFYRNLLSSRHACCSRERTFLNSENMTFSRRQVCILIKITESCSKRENTPNLGQLCDNLDPTLGQH